MNEEPIDEKDEKTKAAKLYLAERGISATFDRMVSADIVVELRLIRQYLEKVLDKLYEKRLNEGR
jgi:hypothetical protein